MGAKIQRAAVYKEKNGNCNDPHKQCSLGKWVHCQRHWRNKGKLLQERTTQLEGIGFVWKLRSRLEVASTQAQSDLPIDGSHEEAGRGSDDSVTGTFNFKCPALPPLPPV